MRKNNQNSKSFESIKTKLRKLQALAEEGYEGEARNAKLLLDKLCKQYGISLEEIFDKEKKSCYKFEIGKGKVWFDLFMQCYANVTGNKELRYYQTSSHIIWGVTLTAYQYVEIRNLFHWHKANLKKDLKDTERLVFEAYVEKHQIYRDRSNDPEDAEEELDDSSFDLDRIRRIAMLIETLNDNRYHKMIEEK